MPSPSPQLVRCNAMLHPHDVPEGIKLLRDSHNQPLPLETDPNVIRRGIHVSVYVKDVFPNSGRFSVTLDPSIDKAKVIAARKQKRLLGKKRNKVKKLEGVEEGAEKQARVVKVSTVGGARSDVGGFEGGMLEGKPCVTNPHKTRDWPHCFTRVYACL